jgi:hypothetical protein
MDFAQITLMGYVGTARVVSEKCFYFTLAINFKDNMKGTVETTWFDCYVLGDKRVPSAALHINTGNRLFINGNINISTEFNPNGHVHVNKLKVIVSDYRLVYKKSR